jgi:hypothetical protein
LTLDEVLLTLKKKIDQDTQKQSEGKIKLDLILETLKNDLSCNSLQEAVDYKKEIEIAKKDLLKLIENDIIKLKLELNID